MAKAKRTRAKVTPSPIERLIAARPGDDIDALLELQKPPTAFPSLEASWSGKGDAGMPWWIGPEIGRDAEGFAHAAFYESEYEGCHAVVLRIVPNEVSTAVGTCALGTIECIDLYEYGADLAALHASGLTLSWTAAQYVYAAAKPVLAELHAARKLHGRLAAKRVRLALYYRPYTTLVELEDTYAPAPPIALVGGRTRDGDAIACARELSQLAEAVATLATHPDPTIDRLLRDPSPEAHAVLRDRLLERDEPVDELLRDRACEPSLPVAPLRHTRAIQRELVALWERAIELDPLLGALPEELRR
jgi:hypothetical protein